MKIFNTAFLLACSCMLAGPAFAQDKANSSRYHYSDGKTAFVLPQGHNAVLEHGAAGTRVMVSKQLGARGDVIYKGSDGHIFVRLSTSGAATYYPQEGSKGLPVSRSAAMPLREDLNSVEEWGAAYQYKGAKPVRAEARPARRPQQPSN